jgi:hypothetical protein
MSESQDVEIILEVDSRSRRICIFTINLGIWNTRIKFSDDRLWIQELYLKLIYKYGKLRNISVNEDEDLFPPRIHFSYPRDRVSVLNALKHAKARHKDRLLKLFERDEQAFEDEAVAIGVSEAFKR